MRSSKKLKICKVTSKAFAKYCLSRDADYIGIHVIDYNLDPSLQALCRYITTHNGRAVLLTKETKLAKLRQLISFYQPWALQLHYPIDIASYMHIAKAINCPIVPVFTNDTDIQTIKQLLAHSQLAIYDSSFVGGTNLQHGAHHLEGLTAIEAQKVLLAGGVTPKFIQTSHHKVGGYDVQSYCRPQKQHHYGRVEQLLQTVKGQPRKQLSVSLTDALNLDVPAYEESGCLEYQVDYSEGRLYPKFVVDSQQILQTIESRDAPFTLHIFEKDPERIQQIIDNWTAKVGSKLVRINLQYAPGLPIEQISTYDAKRCTSIYYKDFEAYLQHYPQAHDCLSLILATQLPEKSRFLTKHKPQLATLAKKEIWFDRRVDDQTVKLVQSYHSNANFIVGDYILKDWTNEQTLLRLLQV
jgi:phosphoribosylanthranilate isomerase